MHPRISIAALFAAFAVTLLSSGCSSPKAQSAGAPPPVPVSVAVANLESVPVEVRAVGTVEPSITVQIKSQIAGELFKVHFVEGGDINKGDLLFEIDPRPYQEALRQAEAAVVRDAALLRQAEANHARDIAQLKFAEEDAGRYEQLAKEGVVSRMQSDQSRTNADALRESIKADLAAIESARGTLESDRAAVANAKLNLSYCEIRSPVAGRAGNLLVHVGNLIKVNDVPLVVINQITPIYVSFGVPEKNLASIRANSNARKLRVRVSPQNDADKIAEGELTVIDNTVDSNTGTIRLKATFANEHRLLWPGQFVNAVLTLETQPNAIVIPSEAIQAGQRGPFVYAVKPDQTVETREVIVGQTIGRKAIIQKGVAAGETVVIDGQLRLFPGAHIQPVAASKVDSQAL